MGQIVLFIAASLDGFIADAEGGVAWLERFDAPGEDHGYGAFMADVGAVVMGASTYEQDVARGGWPYGTRPTWVFTHRDLPVPAGADVRFLEASVTETVDAIRASTDGDVFLVGGAHLVAQFLDVGAIDELVLFVVPILLGDGVRLFRSAPPTELELLGSRAYGTGLVELRYRLPRRR